MPDKPGGNPCSVKIYFDALKQDAEPGARGELMELATAYYQDPEDPEVRRRLEEHYPEVYQSFLETARREAQEAAAADEAATPASE
jgi:hypothetical protein